MIERGAYIPGVPCWVDASRPEPEAAVAFYGGLFGWECEDIVPADAPGSYFIARLRGRDVAAIGSPTDGVPETAAWQTYVAVASADATARAAQEAGGQVLAGPMDVGDAGRMAVLRDPEGAVFCVWQAGRHHGAQLVNEPGTVNFNDLHTRDVEGAARFYGSVFGWHTLDLGGGPAMWTLPGYGDHLEEMDPGMRERMAEVGAPEGFENVVAAIATIPAEQAGTVPHWNVTFAVDDADAVAERAVRLGGRVLVEPTDAPWTRLAVIADPDGATFTASQFVPDNREVTA